MKKQPEDLNDLEYRQSSRADNTERPARQRPRKNSTDKVYYWRIPPVGVSVKKGECYCSGCKVVRSVSAFESPDFVFCVDCHKAYNLRALPTDITDIMKL